MKFIHFSDTHLGYTAYRKTDENGFNQREADILAAFTLSIDKCLELQPDFIIHAGDLFHIVRPTNRIIHFALEQVMRLVKAQIPLVIISGNHETPKQRYIGNVFKILDALKQALPSEQHLLHIIYRQQYEVVKIKGTTIHAIPQCRNGEAFNKELARAHPDPSSSKNILVLHCGVKGMREFAHGDFNELLVDYEYLTQSPFDYVALGHFHNYSKVTKKAFFSGSTERMSFNEAGNEKGLLEIDLSKPLSSPDNPRFHPLKIRPMVEIQTYDARNKDAATLGEAVETILREQKLKDKIVRIKIKNISPAALAILDTKRIREAVQDALHFEPIFEAAADEKEVIETQPNLGGIIEEFIAFMRSQKNLDEVLQRNLLEAGVSYLNQAMEDTQK